MERDMLKKNSVHVIIITPQATLAPVIIIKTVS